MNKTTKTKKPALKKATGSKKKRKKKQASQNRSYLGVIMVTVLLLVILVMIIRNCSREEPDVAEVSTVEQAIQHAAGLLGVPDELYRRSSRDDGVYISIALDRDRVDLIFANMIITGQVQDAGGEIKTGREVSRGSAHLLTVHDPGNKVDYIVRLYYDQRDSYAPVAPKLAIIVDDFGEFSGALLDDFLKTDPNITFSILPDLRYSRTVMDKATAMGREVILHIPMEPVGYPRNNPGDRPVLVEHSDREIARIVEGYLKQLPSVAGANNHMGSLATADERVMAAVLGTLARHDLFFIDSRTTRHSVAVEIAQQMQIPVSQRDLFLDDPDNSQRTLNERIEQLRRLKGQKDRVVVITHCFDRERLENLNRFVEAAKKMGFELVPVSKLFISDLPDIL